MGSNTVSGTFPLVTCLMLKLCGLVLPQMSVFSVKIKAAVHPKLKLWTLLYYMWFQTFMVIFLRNMKDPKKDSIKDVHITIFYAFWSIKNRKCSTAAPRSLFCMFELTCHIWLQHMQLKFMHLAKFYPKLLAFHSKDIFLSVNAHSGNQTHEFGIASVVSYSTIWTENTFSISHTKKRICIWVWWHMGKQIITDFPFLRELFLKPQSAHRI